MRAEAGACDSFVQSGEHAWNIDARGRLLENGLQLAQKERPGISLDLSGRERPEGRGQNADVGGPS